MVINFKAYAGPDIHVKLKKNNHNCTREIKGFLSGNLKMLYHGTGMIKTSNTTTISTSQLLS
jgi:hypothetical protein